MKLKYLKLNDSKFDFDGKILIFQGEENTGKSTIFHLIKFIYGAEYKSGTRLFKALNSIKRKNSNYKISWQFDDPKEPSEFTINLKENIIEMSSGVKINLASYSNFIINKYNFSNKVFGSKMKKIENFSYDKNITHDLESKDLYARFFNKHNAAYYTTICFLKLIEEMQLAIITENHFMLYRKKSSLDKMLKSAKEVIKSVDEEFLEKLESEDLLADSTKRYVELSKLSRTEYDEVVFSEMEVICKDLVNFDINKVKEFHKLMLQSYNEVIDLERHNLEKNYRFLNEFSKEQLREVVTYQKVTKDVNKDINTINSKLEDSSSDLPGSQNTIDKINEDLKNYCDNFNSGLNVLKILKTN